MDSCLQDLVAKVTPAMNEGLLQTFTVEEVGTSLNQMAPMKAPGPDGFSACFYQKHWAMVGTEVSQAILNVLNCGCMNKELNFIYIALIPKVSISTCVTKFHPISLCNFFIRLFPKC
jgi:hypothetical protein